MILRLYHLAILMAIVLTTANATNITQLTSQEFYEMALNDEFSVIVDVRTKAEWDGGHIQNATLLDSLQNANTATEIAKISDLG